MNVKKAILAASFASTLLNPTIAAATEEVDLLIKNATVLTMDGEKNIYKQGMVAVRDNYGYVPAKCCFIQ